MLNSLRSQLRLRWLSLRLRKPNLSLFSVFMGLTWLLGALLSLLALTIAQAHPDSTPAFDFKSYSYNAVVAPLTQAAETSANRSLKPTPGNLVAHPVEGTPTITLAAIENQLARYGSPVSGHGQALYDLGRKYGIDPAYALAFFIHESAAGTRGLATVTLSLGNIRQSAGSGFPAYQGFRKYPSWEAGMEDWYRLIKNLYIQGWQLRTVEAIVPVYAPAADHNDPQAYILAINSLVDGWRKN